LAGRATEAAAVLAAATLVTLAMAIPVLRAPSERVFGMEIAGRHHDPFTVMQQFDRPSGASVYSQPVTDVAGTLLARVSGPVAAYNWLVLLSFPLSALAAYLLARHLALSPPAAFVAAMAYAFSPFHLAQAAYHPHVAQTQWIPLYLLALWRCLDKPSAAAIAFLLASTSAVTLSNFYGGLIAAALTPVAVIAYWVTIRKTARAPGRRLAITVGVLVLAAAAGAAYASYAARPIGTSRAAFAFPRADLFRYSATWWSYFIPPVEHPLLGESARRFWLGAGMREGLLEHQVSLGWAIVALALIAALRWRTDARVPVLAAVGLVALLCSLSPERTIGTLTIPAPSALLYLVVPMFRSYARFGVVVQLMAALLAGIGLDYLRRTGIREARIAAAVLPIIAAGEYAVSPSALWRDTLPTRAHRWVARQPGPVRALDCAPLTQESSSIQWLTGDRVTLLEGPPEDCLEPNLSQKLAANGYTHLVVRRGTLVSQLFDDHAPPEGLTLAARFPDGRVFAITTARPSVYTATMRGFFPREYDNARSWRWMGGQAEWTVVNTGTVPIVAMLGLELSANPSERMDVRLDGRHLQTLMIEPSRRRYQLGPLTVGPGDHELAFQAMGALTIPDDRGSNGDRRQLSFELGTWTWTVRE
jgi:hypothetical protein